MNTIEKFSLEKRVCIITGGAGLLGQNYAEAILDAKGIPVLIDINESKLIEAVERLRNNYGYSCQIEYYKVSITNEEQVRYVRDELLNKYGHIDVLINNAANNPKVEDSLTSYKRFEQFDEMYWDSDLDVGLKGAFFCSKIFGSVMAKQNRGTILNISSDLGLIAPDQRIYRKDGILEIEQATKPVTYSVVKHGLIGLTKYLATYWAEKGVRANAICPGGVFAGQNEEFLEKLTNLIPMGRMANQDEYKAAILFLITDASAYMTGAILAVDGGRTCW